MIKKIILWIFFLFIWLNNTFANQQITLTFPVWWNINLSSQNILFSWNDIEEDDIINTALWTASRICEILWNNNFKIYTLVSFDTQIISWTTTRYYYRPTFNTFSFNNTNNVISSITCEYQSEKQIILQKDKDFNKEIFTKDELIEIYTSQLSILLFLLAFVYTYKVFNPFDKNLILNKNKKW